MTDMDRAWIKLFDTGITAFAYLLFAAILYLVVRKRGTITNRFPALLALSWCFSKGIASLCTMWDLYHGTDQLTTVMQTPASLLTLGFAVYCWIRLETLVLTLRQAELGQKLELDSAVEREQQQLNCLHLSEVSREESTRALHWAKRRAAENDGESFDHRTAAVGASAG